MNKIIKKRSAIFLFFFLSLLISLFFKENSSGGSQIDFEITRQFVENFKLGFLKGLDYFIRTGQLQSPLHYILFAYSENIISLPVIKIIYVIISSLLPISIYIILKKKFKLVDKNYLFAIASIIFLSPYFRSSSSWITNDNIALIEGWGFYAERFCPETIENYYAYSCCKTIHLIRAIIDIHYTQIKDWNKKDALNFITQNWPFSITSEQMENEIKNIDERPGYQICYIIGEKFYDQCFKTYASQFSTCKDYHNTLLQALNKCKDCSTQSITSFFKTD